MPKHRPAADRTIRHRSKISWPQVGLLAASLAVVGIIVVGLSRADSSSTVTTSSGVVTHGAITTTDDTIGWLLTCQPSHELPDDPIVHPGAPGAAHMHDFWGNASTNGASTYISQEAASNQAVAETWNGASTKPGTSCDLNTFAPGTAGDTASYWAPVLYADGQKIQPGDKAQLYYRAKPTFGTGFQPFPQDARIIVGNHAATSIATNPGIADGHLYWECHGTTETHYQLPPNSCTDILANVVFPSCYDGGPMDHKGPSNTDNEHFAYAVNGSCPSTFPIKVPQLSEKFKYTVPKTGMNLQLSADPMPGMPGMTGGLMPTYTMHADFWNTWNPASLQYLVDRCLNAAQSCGTNPIVPVSVVTATPPLPSSSPAPTTSPTPTPTPVTTPTLSPTPSGKPSSADLTGDGRVDIRDLSRLLSNWGQPGVGDFDHNNTVSVSDLSYLLSHWTG